MTDPYYFGERPRTFSGVPQAVPYYFYAGDSIPALNQYARTVGFGSNFLNDKTGTFDSIVNNYSQSGDVFSGSNLADLVAQYWQRINAPHAQHEAAVKSLVRDVLGSGNGYGARSSAANYLAKDLRGYNTDVRDKFIDRITNAYQSPSMGIVGGSNLQYGWRNPVTNGLTYDMDSLTVNPNEGWGSDAERIAAGYTQPVYTGTRADQSSDWWDIQAMAPGEKLTSQLASLADDYGAMFAQNLAKYKSPAGQQRLLERFGDKGAAGASAPSPSLFRGGVTANKVREYS